MKLERVNVRGIDELMGTIGRGSDCPPFTNYFRRTPDRGHHSRGSYSGNSRLHQ